MDVDEAKRISTTSVQRHISYVQELNNYANNRIAQLASHYELKRSSQTNVLASVHIKEETTEEEQLEVQPLPAAVTEQSEFVTPLAISVARSGLTLDQLIGTTITTAAVCQ